DVSITPPNRNYILESVFASQLLESAEDELSFRTAVRDMQTKSPVLQIILLNPNSWGCSGSLHPAEPTAKLVMHPISKCYFLPLVMARCLIQAPNHKGVLIIPPSLLPAFRCRPLVKNASPSAENMPVGESCTPGKVLRLQIWRSPQACAAVSRPSPCRRLPSKIPPENARHSCWDLKAREFA
ncbi:UNVERIFIED_CONTAM: hypothetical protein Sradi_4103700, partial [Sesamum radiatum]